MCCYKYDNALCENNAMLVCMCVCVCVCACTHMWFYVGCRVFQAHTDPAVSPEELYATSPPSSSFTMKEGIVPLGLQPEGQDMAPMSPGKNQGQLESLSTISH